MFISLNNINIKSEFFSELKRNKCFPDLKAYQ